MTTTAPVAAPPRWGVAVTVAIGALIAVQGRINSGLATGLGGGTSGGLVAAAISFTTGALLASVAVLASPALRTAVRRLRSALRPGSAARLRPWHLLGGVSGAVFVVGQGVAVAPLGVAVFTVAVVAGQTVSGLVVDRLGVGPTGVVRVSAPRALGAAVTLVAVAIAVSDRLGSGSTLVLAALPAVAGAGMAWQSAVNGRVGVAAGNPAAAAWVNFAVGAAILLVVAPVVVLTVGPTTGFPGNPLLYVGGAVGLVFITLTAWAVRLVGVLVVGLGTVTGQLLGAVALDVVAPQPGAELAVSTVVGSALTVLGVLVASAQRRPTRLGD